MSRRVIRIFKKIDEDASNSVDPNLAFAENWCNHLIDVLKKHRKDKEFIRDVISSAAKYFHDNMDDDKQTDAFIYLLSKAVKD
jgi:hypothetical protein